MEKRFIALVLGALTLLLALGATTALADPSPGVQAAGQSATSAQQASAASEATQTNPSNTNISVRVLSPGNDGSVSQTNSVSSNATAANSNSADQSTSQSQAGGGGIQTGNQSAGNAQLAAALSSASQYGATNTNTPVRVLSPGNAGSVSQSNDASSTASSSNDNHADQSADQNQTGGGSCGCEPAAAPATAGDQPATAPASATQQTNAADSSGAAGNSNSTDQASGQSQGGSGSGIQTSDQKAGNEQAAVAASSAVQERPTNTNISVRVLSPGNDGSVSQTNSVSSNATASNHNSTDQSSNQDQSGGGGCGCQSTDPAVQTSDQSSWNKQAAGALSSAKQEGAKNTNLPVRVGSPGNDGSVSQSNSVDSHASADNSNGTDQTAHQDESGASGTSVQTVDQAAKDEQLAAALSAAKQSDASNHNSPLRVGSPGGGGSVDQSNSADSTASASNNDRTDQDAEQSDPPSRSTCGCNSGVGIQVLGQDADSKQASFAGSATLQVFGKSECGCSTGGNSNGPVRVWSDGSDGSVTQSNSADSTASARNWNDTDQTGRQDQSGGAGIAIQALGQQAKNGQLAVGLSAAFQIDPSNHNGPTRVYSPGNGGSVTQANDASSDASADNWNDTDQTAGQSQHGSGSCGCASDVVVQALGQSASSLQAALVLSKAFQSKPHNANGPTSVWSSGNAGSSTQGNHVGSEASGENRDDADQLGRELQA